MLSIKTGVPLLNISLCWCPVTETRFEVPLEVIFNGCKK